jgi:hypothetical protein
MAHVVIEVVHDPEGAGDEDEEDGEHGEEDEEVPAGARFGVEVEEENELDGGLEEGEKGDGEDERSAGEDGIGDEVVGGKGEEGGEEEAEDVGFVGAVFGHRAPMR